LTLKDVVSAAVGVPLIAPVVALTDIHAGAPTSEYVYGVVPPAAVQLAPVYATFTCAVAGNVQVNVSVAGATTKLVTANVAVCDPLSVTLTLNDVVAAAVGVPLIAPVVALIDIQEGAPTSEYVYGVVPPTAVQLAPVYATFTCAVVGNVQPNVSVAGATTKLATACVAVCGVEALSVAETVNE
jgi:hypothetical protein